MRYLLAPDKFKGSLTAARVAEAMRDGLLRADAAASIDLCPVADGGEGTVSALVTAAGGFFHTARVTGPLPEMKIDATFGILGDGKTAAIEMSAASGLALLRPEDRNPLYTTTFGTGELMLAAAKLGVSRIILGIGGSATIDAGIGCAQACGLPVILENGEPVSPTEPLVGQDLPRVVLVKHGRGSPIDKIQIDVASDVANPLCGPTGAARVYGPQKGATPDQIEFFDAALLELARRNNRLTEANSPGAGAAGGLGFAMIAFFGATLRSGVDLVLEAVNFPKRLAAADLCLTGEGRLDAQSLHGKAVAGVARACEAAGVRCIAIVGSADPAIDFTAAGICAVYPISDGSAPIPSPSESIEQIKTAAEIIPRLSSFSS